MVLHRLWPACCLLALANLPSAIAIAPPAARSPFTVRDLVKMNRLFDVKASADGRRAVCTLTTADLQDNGGRTSVWVVETTKRGVTARRLSADNFNDRAGTFSADGQSVYFLSTRTGLSQIWRVPAAGGGATQVTNLPLDVDSFRISPRGNRLLASMQVYPDCPDLNCTADRLKAPQGIAGSGIVYKRIFVRHWNTWSDGRRSQLFSVALDGNGIAGAAAVNLTAGMDADVPSKPFGGNEDYDISPDGEQVVFSARVAPVGEPWSTNFDVYQVAASGGTPRNLTADNPAEDTHPAFSPDGRQIAYLASQRPGFESDKQHLVLIDVNTAVKRPLTSNWDRSITRFAWSPDGKLLFALADHLGQRPLWVIDARSGLASAISAAGEVEDFSVGQDRVFFTLSNLANAADLYSTGFGGGKIRQLTVINGELHAARSFGEYEQFHFAGANHDNVFGYLVKPANWQSGHSYPVALLIHGGPQESMANSWHWRWNAQLFAGAGFAVLMIDFHGSTGYGQAFTDSINRDWGGKPLEDLKKGLAAAVIQYPWLDAQRICALGGSYGGYLVNWIAGQWPERFRCLVSHAGIFDNRMMYYSTEELWFPEWEYGGPEYQNPAAYTQQNPIDFVSSWKTPMLIIHGRNDYRVPYTQGLAAFTALQRRGIPSQFLYFGDEDHWVLKPANSVQWYDTVLQWLNRWTTAPGAAP
jgi:dipeptidyl aminopeptidase/acylaminoacyl peptidase